MTGWASTYTGRDVDGGWAEYALVRVDHAYRLPAGHSDAEFAPLLCAGIVGYLALRRAELLPGGRLGIYGVGASARRRTWPPRSPSPRAQGCT